MNKGGKCERRDDEGSKKRNEGDFHLSKNILKVAYCPFFDQVRIKLWPIQSTKSFLGNEISLEKLM